VHGVLAPGLAALALRRIHALSLAGHAQTLGQRP